MKCKKELTQIIKPVEPEQKNKIVLTIDEYNNNILDIIENITPELCSESDIIYCINAAESLKNEPTIYYNLETLSETVDSYNYLYYMDGAYYLLEPYNNSFISDIINIPDLMFYNILNLDYNKLDIKTAADFIESIDININMEFLDFLKELEYMDIFLPDILYKDQFINSFKNNMLDLTDEIKKLLEYFNENDNYNFISTTTEFIESEFIDAAESYIYNQLVLYLNTAASKTNYNQYKILDLYQYQEY